jgi:hypothetical protein
MTVARKRKNQSRSVRRYKKEAFLNEGIAGADSTRPVTQKLIDSAIDVLASAPKFWGRYFKGAGNTNPAQYQAGRENPVLERAKVRVLPIARQTNNAADVALRRISRSTIGLRHMASRKLMITE